MKRAYTNGILLDGTEQMQPVAHKILLTEDDKITAIADEGMDLDGYEVIDLHGSYIMPGLVNLHVHLAGNGKPSAKPRDNAALVRKILSNGLTRAVAYRLVCSYAKLELLGGVTTIRTVGGIADFDTRCRDDAAAGRLLAPRILAANEGISVPGGHMAGSVAVAAHNNAEALAQLKKASGQKVELKYAIKGKRAGYETAADSKLRVDADGNVYLIGFRGSNKELEWWQYPAGSQSAESYAPFIRACKGYFMLPDAESIGSIAAGEYNDYYTETIKLHQNGVYATYTYCFEGSELSCILLENASGMMNNIELKPVADEAVLAIPSDYRVINN